MFHPRRSRRALSPILATVILIAITIAGGLLVFSMFESSASTQKLKAVIDIESAQLIAPANSNYTFVLVVKNVGSLPITNMDVVFAGLDLKTPGLNPTPIWSPLISAGNPLTPRIFCAERTTVPFEEMMKPGRLSIFRLSKFHLPEDFRVLITNSVILRIYFMIRERARELEGSGMSAEARTPVFLVIDEFQNASQMEVFETIVSEARKYGLYLIMAHQNPAQIPEKLFEEYDEPDTPELEKKIRESILQRLEASPATPIHSLAEVSGVSDRKVQKYLDEMIGEGILAKMGSSYEVARGDGMSTG
jgi:flagellin-like protein